MPAIQPSHQVVLAACDGFDRRFYNGRIDVAEARRNHSGFLIYEGRSYPVRVLAESTSTTPQMLATYIDRSGLRRIPDRNWTEGEISLVSMLLHYAGWERTLRATEEPVREMAQLLRRRSPLHRFFDNHRSPSSVQRKLEDLRTARDDYKTKRTKGGGLTQTVAVRYDCNPDEVLRAARLELFSDVPSAVCRVLF